MSAVAVLSAVLGAVFVVAGVAKVASGRRWVVQARDLGAPAIVATALPWVEIVLGGLAVAQVARRWVALALALMLVAFSALLAGNLARGRRPPCACFGSWGAAPLGLGHLARNAVLLALAVVVAVVA